MKSIDGIPVSHPDTKLLPPLPYLDLTTWNGKKDANVQKEREALKPYLDQLEKFYKKNHEIIGYEESNKIFNQILEHWIRIGYVSDRDGKARLMLDRDDVFDTMKAEFLKNIIDPKIHRYLSHSTKGRADLIFNLIYYAEKNDNDISDISKYFRNSI